ncbi:hypothetical protein F5Y03DRAFT_405491 [Xylaria venustula]|nr:hypothetical protein F5Y03DRAFT_405491 [Xylaria venustula]
MSRALFFSFDLFSGNENISARLPLRPRLRPIVVKLSGCFSPARAAAACVFAAFVTLSRKARSGAAATGATLLLGSFLLGLLSTFTIASGQVITVLLVPLPVLLLRAAAPAAAFAAASFSAFALAGSPRARFCCRGRPAFSKV